MDRRVSNQYWNEAMWSRTYRRGRICSAKLRLHVIYCRTLRDRYHGRHIVDTPNSLCSQVLRPTMDVRYCVPRYYAEQFSVCAGPQLHGTLHIQYGICLASIDKYWKKSASFHIIPRTCSFSKPRGTIWMDLQTLPRGLNTTFSRNERGRPETSLICRG